MNGSVQTVKREEEEVSEVWRKIFSPKIGDFVEFRWQVRGKHYTIHGWVRGIGTIYYSMQICEKDRKKFTVDGWCRLPQVASVRKENKKLKVMTEEEKHAFE